VRYSNSFAGDNEAACAKPLGDFTWRAIPRGGQSTWRANRGGQFTAIFSVQGENEFIGGRRTELMRHSLKAMDNSLQF